MKRALLLGLVLAACGGEQQIVIVLEGDLMATSYEVILAESQVVLKRNQHSNTNPGDVETAFYVVQRDRVDVELDQRTLLSGIELQLVGADGALPIVKAFDGELLIGMGILDPQRVFDDQHDHEDNFANRLEARGDITEFPIVVERVTLPPVLDGGGAAKPVPILEGEVRAVKCQEGLSGLAWRPQSNPAYATGQLRIVLPLGDTLDAGPRVEAEGLDLDCDKHTPRLRGITTLGDEQDCDDTSSIVFGGEPPAAEVCTTDRVDTDCDSSTIGADVVKTCQTCLGNRLTCYETPGLIDEGGCANPDTGCLACQLATSTVSGALAVCSSLGELVLPLSCGAGCVARLISIDPQWQVRIGTVGDPQAGFLQGHEVVGGTIGIAIERNLNVPLDPAALTGVALAVQGMPGASVNVIEVKFGTSSPTPSTAECRPFELIGRCNLEL